MPGLSVHVVDVARGVPASGMRVEIFALGGTRQKIADGLMAKSGALDHPITATRLEPGTYEVVFHAGEFFSSQGIAQSDPPFFGEVPFRFNIADADQHYHLPMKITPWGFSLYRGS